MMEQTPKVSIIILNYKTYNQTILEINNIEDVLEYDNLEIVIVDNCSQNDSVEQLSSAVKKCKKYYYTLIESPHNSGYAAGNNFGLKESNRRGAKYSLIVNNDILFTDSQSIKKMVDFMESDESVGGLSPRIESKDGYHDKPIFYKKPSFWDLSLGIWNYKKRRFDQNDELIYEIYAPRGCCMMIRNDDLQKLGLLDEDTFLYYEEPILAESLMKLNKKIVHYGSVKVIHNHASTISTNVEKKVIRKHVINSLDVYLKKYRHFNDVERMICKLIRKYAYIISGK